MNDSVKFCGQLLNVISDNLVIREIFVGNREIESCVLYHKMSGQQIIIKKFNDILEMLFDISRKITLNKYGEAEVMSNQMIKSR